MKKRIFRSQDNEILYNKIINVPNYWYSEPLEEHPLRDQFNRTLEVNAFNAPEGALYVMAIQVLRFKDTGEVYKRIQMPLWEVTSGHSESIKVDGEIMLADDYDIDDFGEIIPETKVEVEVKVSSVKYVRAMSLYKMAYVPDIFNAFMPKYKELFSKEINDI